MAQREEAVETGNRTNNIVTLVIICKTQDKEILGEGSREVISNMYSNSRCRPNN